MMMDPITTFLTSIINAGPLAVATAVMGVFVLTKLSRFIDIKLDRMAKQ